MATVVLTGPDDALARRVRSFLDADETVDNVIVVVDGQPVFPELKAAAAGATALVHLAPGIDETKSALALAADAGIDHVVLLSSTTVYGAWPNNPLPLTEAAPLRPNPGFAFAAEAAERERLAAEWRADYSSSTVAALRAAPALAEDAVGWLPRALRAAHAIQAGDDEAPAQFVHLDDVAAAIDIARRRRLDGAYNVAPDGSIGAEDLRALAGVPRLRLPRRLAIISSAIRWRLGVSPAPPGIVPYTMYPWVAANDHLRASGWAPTHTNEETYVAGYRPVPWAMLSPKRRQELTLGVAASLLAGIGAAVALLVRRALRRPERAGG